MNVRFRCNCMTASCSDWQMTRAGVYNQGMKRLTPLAASLLWIAMLGICLAAFRHALNIAPKGGPLALMAIVSSFGCMGGAVGSWFRWPAAGLAIGLVLGLLAIAILAQDARD